MAQFKKDRVRAAILTAAATLFQQEGYTQVGLRAIAKHAKVSLANIYVYFDSKLEIIYALYTPWFTARIKKLQADALLIADVDDRLRFIIAALWKQIPREEGLSANLIEAVSAARPGDHYTPKLLHWAQKQIADLLSNCLADHPVISRDSVHELAFVILMALDGFTINRRLRNADTCSEEMIDLVCSLIQHRQRAPARSLRSANRRPKRGAKPRHLAI